MRSVRYLGLLVALMALAGCGGDDEPARSGEATRPPAGDSGAWVEQATDVCDRHIPWLVRHASATLAAERRAERGAAGGWERLSAEMRRHSDRLARLYDELKKIPRPTKDPSVDRFLFNYAKLAGDYFRGVDAMLYDRQVARQYIADANAAGIDAHEVAEKLGAEACTKWLVGS
jgi:hypothetical protein